jgi:ABC-type antimicrobial peptide transport system permease subunit
MVREIRFAFRRLVRSPGFVVIAVVTLALAIEASSAVLSLVNALLIRPLPYRAPQQLVLLLQHFKSPNLERIPVSPPEFAAAAVGGSARSVGIYGVMSFLVVQRTHEIGVRMALGAQRADVMRLVIGRALRLIAIGTAIGLLMALFSTWALQALLYQVSAVDLPTFFFVTFVLGLVALAASYLPAQRAMRADPMIALSHNT